MAGLKIHLPPLIQVRRYFDSRLRILLLFKSTSHLSFRTSQQSSSTPFDITRCFAQFIPVAGSAKSNLRKVCVSLESPRSLSQSGLPPTWQGRVKRVLVAFSSAVRYIPRCNTRGLSILRTYWHIWYRSASDNFKADAMLP